MADKIPKVWHWLGLKHHLIAEFTDQGTALVISKWWNPGKFRWVYECEPRWLIQHRRQLVKSMPVPNPVKRPPEMPMAKYEQLYRITTT